MTNPLEDMRMFQETVEAGSFTAAAERLGTSKQLVSKRLIALEQRLGVRLLNRTTRKLDPTPLGLAYLEKAREVLAAVVDAEESVSRQAVAPRGALRVSAPMSFGTLHLAARLPAFLDAYPDVQLTLDLNDRMVDLVGEGYDLAVRIGTLHDSSLAARTITRLAMRACASPAYLDAHGTPQQPADLRRHACLVYGHVRSVHWLFAHAGKPLAVEVSGPLCSNNGDVLRDAAVAGHGLVQLPEFLLEPALSQGRLVRVLDAYAPAPLPLSAVYPQHRQASPTVRAFVDFLVAEFGQDAQPVAPATRPVPDR